MEDSGNGANDDSSPAVVTEMIIMTVVSEVAEEIVGDEVAEDDGTDVVVDDAALEGVGESVGEIELKEVNPLEVVGTEELGCAELTSGRDEVIISEEDIC